MSEFTRVIGTPLPGTKLTMPTARPYPAVPTRPQPDKPEKPGEK